MATTFYIAMTTSQLLSAWLGATLGQRRAFSAALLLFAAASVLGAVADDFGVIVFARVIQGIGAGLIQTQTMLALFQAFPPERRGTAMGYYATGMVLAIGVGPYLGGVVVEAFGWRYIFLAPLPLVFGIFGAGLFAMPSVRSKRLPTFDWLGYTLLIVAFYCVMTGLADGQRQGWISDPIVGLFAVALLASGTFVWLQISRPTRLVDFSLFRHRPFMVSCLVGFVVGMGNFGTIYAVPVFAQLVQNLTPLDAGMLMLPASLIAICVMPVIGKLADSITPRTGIVMGLLFFAIGTLPMAIADANTPFLHVLLFVVIIRLGMSVNLPFVTRTALASIPADKVNIGAGTLNFFRQLGASLGTAVWVVFLDIRTHFHSDTLAATQNSANETSQELLASVRRVLEELGVPGVDHQSGALHYLGQVIHAQATTRGFQDGFLILSLGFLVAIVPACLLGRRRPGS
nr:DHA2 family efflux MFS transporter permease subunit [Alphaproteobacteria bacterium]